jgi:hypothetical protein
MPLLSTAGIARPEGNDGTLPAPAEALESLEADPEALALPDFPDLPALVTLVSCEALPEFFVLALAPCCDAETEVCDDAAPEVCVFAEVCATAVAKSKLETNKPLTTDFM